MAVERFYSGDPLSASRFNRLVATVCNLRRKVAEIKRRPKGNLLRNNSFARYPYACRTATCGCGFVSCFCYKPCVGVFPIYKPPFDMHWKMSEWECNGRYYSTETTTLVVNRGSWFKGNKRVDFPEVAFCAATCGEYFVGWQGGVFRGTRADSGLLPVCAFLIGCVKCGVIVSHWSGDIWQPPATRYCVPLRVFSDYGRFWSNQIYENCQGYTCTKNCVFTPVRADNEPSVSQYPPCVCSYLSIAETDRVAAWVHGSRRIGFSTNLPTLCVNIHGRCSGHPASCFYWYSGNPVYVCKKCLRDYGASGYAPTGTTGGVFGYSRINSYTGEHYACRWVDTPIAPVQNALSVWSTAIGCGGEQTCGYDTPCWKPDRCILIQQCGKTETQTSTEHGSWRFTYYIADVVACKKEPADTVYSIPKKQSVSETYYTGENCNGN